MVEKDSYFKSRNKFVKEPVYRKQDLSADEAQHVVSMHESICSEIATAFDNAHLFEELMRDVRRLKHGILGSFLQMTIRTRKTAG